VLVFCPESHHLFRLFSFIHLQPGRETIRCIIQLRSWSLCHCALLPTPSINHDTSPSSASVTLLTTVQPPALCGEYIIVTQHHHCLSTSPSRPLSSSIIIQSLSLYVYPMLSSSLFVPVMIAFVVQTCRPSCPLHCHKSCLHTTNLFFPYLWMTLRGISIVR